MVPISHSSLSGYAATTGETLVIGDVLVYRDGGTIFAKELFER